jgi:transposase InsO family protein
MAYTTNPRMPRVRMEAVKLVRSGWSTVQVAKHMGYSQSAIVKWAKRAPKDGRLNIETRSSRPHHHPKSLPQQMIDKIVSKRKEHNRCGLIVYEELKAEGMRVSLSSVKRTLKREGLLRERSPWKRWHSTFPRPIATSPGELVQIDTIHIVSSGKRFYIYTLIDLYSRLAYAKVVKRVNTHQSLKFVYEAEKKAGFRFLMIQSDHGSEFSSWFTENIGVLGMSHRHSRVKQSNDNAHIERFNRSIQEECLDMIPKDFYAYKKAVKGYLEYYNGRRLHIGIDFLTPLRKLAETIPSY